MGDPFTLHRLDNIKGEVARKVSFR
jgi:hypothetical protein